MSADNTIRVCSYNCRGWNSSSVYVSQLLNYYDLCLIQEHWLLPSHINKLNLSNDFLSAGISGMMIQSCFWVALMVVVELYIANLYHLSLEVLIHTQSVFVPSLLHLMTLRKAPTLFF